MRIGLILFAGFIISCNNNRGETEQHTGRYLSEHELNTMKKGDSASISVSYPQGTNFFRYEMLDSMKLTQQIGHETRPGNPNEAGGAMGESFMIRAIDTGNTIIQLVDRSDGARKIFEKDSTLVNIHRYPVKITL